MNNTQPNTLHRSICTVRTAIALVVGFVLSSNIYAKIYTCVDAKGRRLTSDRPIAACLDREQKQMGASGIVRRVVKPSYTAAERKEQERLRNKEQAEAAKKRAQEKALAALLQRYPTPASHQKERADDAGVIEARIRDGYDRLKQIESRKKALDNELAFYTKNPEKTPRVLQIRKKSLEDNIKKTFKYIAQQRKELEQLHKNFDLERDQLIPLWEKQ